MSHEQYQLATSKALASRSSPKFLSSSLHFVCHSSSLLDLPTDQSQSLGVNAFAYMLMARMIHFYGVTPFSIPAPILGTIFVLLDIVSFVIQLVGGSYAGPTAPMDQQLKGVHIYMGGIGLQQFFIFVFLGFAVKFQLGMASLERLGQAKYGWKRLLWTLYGTLGFITVSLSLDLSFQDSWGIHRSEYSSVSLSSRLAKCRPTLYPSTKFISMCLKQYQCLLRFCVSTLLILGAFFKALMLNYRQLGH